MTRYALNSAVLAAPGLYRYRLVSVDQARKWLAAGPVESRIGYPATVDFIRVHLGADLPLSREASAMEVGDEALVVRLKYRVDPNQKGGPQAVQPRPEDFELGVLTRLPGETR